MMEIWCDEESQQDAWSKGGHIVPDNLQMLSVPFSVTCGTKRKFAEVNASLVLNLGI